MELSEDRRPPQHIWLNDKELAAHFQALDSKTASSTGVEAVPDMDQNELTKMLKE